MDDTFVLAIPPLAAHLGTARTFVTQIMQHGGFDDGVVEDVKLAISEACAGSVDPAGPGERVVVRSTLAPEMVVFQIEGTGDFAPEGASEAPARLDLIRTLFPDASLDTHEDGRTTVSFTLQLGG